MGRPRSDRRDDLFDAQQRKELEAERELDDLVRPIIDARVAAFLVPADKASEVLAVVHHDTKPVSETERARRARETEDTNRRRLLRQYLYRPLKAIVVAVPSASRQQIIGAVKDLLPSGGAHRPRAPFDAALVRAAHAKIGTARPAWDSDATSDAIGARLRISRRTVQELLRRARSPRRKK